MLTLRIVEIVFPLFSIAGLGAFYAWRFKPDMNVPNALSMNVLLPALIFSVLVTQDSSIQDFQPLLIAALVVVLGSGVAALLIAKLCRFDIKTFVPPMMFSNSGNMGLPLLTLTFGPAALPVATVLFLVENTLHFTLGSLLLSQRNNPPRNLLTPIIIATILALLFRALEIPVNETLMKPVEMLGDAAIPMMIFSLGTRLVGINIRDWKISLVSAIAAPLFGVGIAFLALNWIDLPPLQAGALILFGALPPAVLNFMFAERFQQEPAKVASIVITSHLMTVASLPLVLAFVIPAYG